MTHFIGTRICTSEWSPTCIQVNGVIALLVSRKRSASRSRSRLDYLRGRGAHIFRALRPASWFRNGSLGGCGSGYGRTLFPSPRSRNRGRSLHNHSRFTRSTPFAWRFHAYMRWFAGLIARRLCGGTSLGVLRCNFSRRTCAVGF